MKHGYFLFLMAFFSGLGLANAQITPPDSIVVELTGPSGSAYALPAKIVVKAFGPASTAFAGSNNKPETGTTNDILYSQQVESGATFFALSGSMTGFPSRSSGPPINRTGGSSFLAIKADGQGNRKYWMNLSVGAYQNTGTTIFNWEYHFRYFYDSKTGTETGTIGSVPNSGAYNPTPVEFIVSIGSQKCKDFEGVVKNAVANIIAARITNDPLAGAKVTLKEGAVTIHSLTTDNTGAFKFATDTLSKEKLYNVTVDFNADSIPLTYKIDNVKVCNAAPEFYIPNKLYRQVLTESAGLKNLKIDASIFGGTIENAIPIKDYDLAAIHQEIGKWTKIEAEHKAILETMNRTYLSLYLLNQYYSKSNQVSGKLLKMTYELGKGILDLVKSSNDIEKLVNEEVQKIDDKLLEGTSGAEKLQLQKDLYILNKVRDGIKFIQKSLLDGFKEGIVKSALAKFGNSENDQLAKLGILAISKAIETAMFGGEFVGDLMKDIAFNIGTKVLVDQYYIGSTQTFINKISPKISAHQYQGEFANVAPLVNSQVAESENKNVAAINAAEAFESASGQFGTVADFTESVAKVAALTVVGSPLAPPLLTISKFVRGFSLASSAGALFNYTHRYYNITDELEAGLAKTFNPAAGNQLRVESDLISARLEESTLPELKAYQDSLSKYKAAISTSSIVQEIALLDRIDPVRTVLETKLSERRNLYFAALSGNPNNAELAKAYNEVVDGFGQFNTRNLTLQFEIIAHLVDTNNVAIDNAIKKDIDTIVVVTGTLAKSIAKMDSILPFLSGAYQYVKISQVVAPDTIKHDSQFEVVLKYKNYGNTATTAFDLFVEPSEKLVIDKDSIRVPALPAQQEGSVKLKLTTADIDPNPSLFVNFKGVNGIGETVLLQLYSKRIVKRGDVISSLLSETVNNAKRNVEVYPNPADGFVSVRTNRTAEEMKVQLFDAQGGLHYSETVYKAKADENIIIPTSDLKTGLYILHLQDTNGHSIREKVMVGHSN